MHKDTLSTLLTSKAISRLIKYQFYVCSVSMVSSVSTKSADNSPTDISDPLMEFLLSGFLGER